jgi:hypothetical protein
MRNVWVQTDFAFATWVADLGDARARPRDLLDVVLTIVEAGARHRVFVPGAFPELGVDPGPGSGPSSGGDLARRIVSLWEDRRVVDAFGFTGAAMAPGAPGSSTAEAELAWFDRQDAIVVAPTANLGAVLRALEPVPGSIGDGFTAAFPPVQITGRRLAFEGEPPVLVAAQARRPIQIRVALHSDIWLPYVFGSAHPLADHQRHFDNRDLARIHTPRLNAFLRDVATAVARAQGRWELDLDDTSTDARQWLDADGVHLDAPAPALFPPDAFAAEWF